MHTNPLSELEVSERLSISLDEVAAIACRLDDASTYMWYTYAGVGQAVVTWLSQETVKHSCSQAAALSTYTDLFEACMPLYISLPRCPIFR